jgi:hypothetical protein
MKKTLLAPTEASPLMKAAPTLAIVETSAARHDLHAAAQPKLKTNHLHNGPIAGPIDRHCNDATAQALERHDLARLDRRRGATKQALGV